MTAIDMTAAPAPLPGSTTPPAPPPVRFNGTTEAYVWMLVRGSALLAVTLGIYRFWLNTDVRRFLWSKTEVAGESLEYTGTAVELLIGFLIGLAILIPLYVVFFVIALNMGPVGQFASVIGFVLLALFGQYAVYRARRYRLTRTVYRGVRFHQTGSAVRYAFCAMFWWVMMILTLGLAYPFMQAQLERYKMRHTFYGNLQGAFAGSGFRLFLRGLLMWILVVTPFVFGVAAALGTIDWPAFAEAADISDPDELLRQLAKVKGAKEAAVFGGTGVGLSTMFAFFLYPFFQAMVLRWWMSGLRLGGLTFTSKLRKRRIYGAYARFIGISMLYSMAVGIAAGIVGLSFTIAAKAAGDNAALQITGAVLSIGLYVIAMLGYSVIYRATVQLSTWRLCVQSLDLAGLAVLDTVKAEGGPSSAVGEGLADALNVGGI
jgi:uncharacterized membrane protein YjgN (DUF898 family)